ncbi:MAG: hypothetical protein HY064_05080 [Bacteroidetes bacterium]|nr:hypothetical protein [Bacteroidota bacterium]
MQEDNSGYRHIFVIGFFIGLFALLAFVIIYFIATGIHVIHVPDKKDSLKKNDSVSAWWNQKPGAEFHDSLFSFCIVYYSVKADSMISDSISRIDIYHLPDNKKIQSVIPDFSYETERIQLDYLHPFVMEDMNFDGYSDFRVLSWVGIRDQQMNECWIYDPEKNIFREDSVLDETWDVVFDHKKKTVYSNERDGCCYDHCNRMMAWEGDSLVVLREEDVMSNPMDTLFEDADITLSKRVHGKLKVIKDFHLDSITEKYLGYDSTGWCFQQ